MTNGNNSSDHLDILLGMICKSYQNKTVCKSRSFDLGKPKLEELLQGYGEASYEL